MLSPSYQSHLTSNFPTQISVDMRYSTPTDPTFLYLAFLQHIVVFVSDSRVEEAAPLYITVQRASSLARLYYISSSLIDGFHAMINISVFPSPWLTVAECHILLHYFTCSLPEIIQYNTNNSTLNSIFNTKTPLLSKTFKTI